MLELRPLDQRRFRDTLLDPRLVRLWAEDRYLLHRSQLAPISSACWWSEHPGATYALNSARVHCSPLAVEAGKDEALRALLSRR